MVGNADSLATAKSSEAGGFLKRVPAPPENVFLEWSAQYRRELAKMPKPETSLFGKDYEACSGVLQLIRGGDNLGKYSRDELMYLMGGVGKAP
jgi:hypothetical protein